MKTEPSVLLAFLARVLAQRPRLRHLLDTRILIAAASAATAPWGRN
jgi:hypothetical protein